MTEENINIIFEKKQQSNKFSFKKAVFKNMIDDYNYFIEGSIEKSLERELIIAFSKINRQYIGDYIDKIAP